MANWTADDLDAALVDLGALDDDANVDLLRGNRGNDHTIGGVGDNVRP